MARTRAQARRRLLVWGWLLRYAPRRWSTRPCRGCDAEGFHDAHLTLAARLALRLP